MTKKSLSITIIPLVLITLAFIFLFNSPATPAKNQVANPLAVSIMHATYPADFSDNRVLVGAAHNVFVGKVVSEGGTKERGLGPETQFEVEVKDNVKGSLEGTVMVNQQGGYKDGVLYVMEGDLFTEGSDEESLLQVGSTYLFSTRYNEENDWHTVMSYPSANKVLSSDKRREDFSQLIAEDGRVQEFKAAYAEEVPLKADVANRKTYNAFADLDREQVEEVENTDTQDASEVIPGPILEEEEKQSEAGSSTAEAVPAEVDTVQLEQNASSSSDL